MSNLWLKYFVKILVGNYTIIYLLPFSNILIVPKVGGGDSIASAQVLIRKLFARSGEMSLLFLNPEVRVIVQLEQAPLRLPSIAALGSTPSQLNQAFHPFQILNCYQTRVKRRKR